MRTWNFSFISLSQIVLLIAITFLMGCATNQDVAARYNMAVKQTTSGQTTLLFLIDGLPIRTLQKMLAQQQLPNIQKFFLPQGALFYRAKTVFPSLTFPGITSLLTEKSIDQHGIYGNKMSKAGRAYNFETPGSRHFLNDKIREKNIFHRLAQKGLKSVSLGFNFWADTTAATNSTDFDLALSLATKNYEAVDSHLIRSLEIILEKTSVSAWPDFIFIHLVGLDFTSHSQGPDSLQALQYLAMLDKRLGLTFDKLAKTENLRQRTIVGFLTADHGFAESIDRKIDLKTFVSKEAGVEIFNEGRIAAVHFSKAWNSEKIANFFNRTKMDPILEFKILRKDDELWIQSATGLKKYLANAVPAQDFSYPDFAENLMRYFNNPAHPSMIIVAKPHFAFSDDDQVVDSGYHGGPSDAETFVPLLIHNGSYRDTSRIPYLHEILGFL
jgi:hypothetical protein